jgi:hypothetical protein
MSFLSHLYDIVKSFIDFHSSPLFLPIIMPFFFQIFQFFEGGEQKSSVTPFTKLGMQQLEAWQITG